MAEPELALEGELASWTSSDIPDQSGRTAVVTGANSGLGLVTARELARAGATVVLAARGTEKLESARDAILAEVPDARLEPGARPRRSLLGARVRGYGRRRAREARAAGQQRRRDDAAPRAHRRRLRASVRDQPPRALRAHRPAPRPARRRLRTPAWSPSPASSTGPARSTSTTSTAERRYSPRGNYQRSKFANAVFGLELDRRLREAGLRSRACSPTLATPRPTCSPPARRGR